MIPISPRWNRASQAPCAALEASPIRVLVVEDDLMVGAVAAEALEEAGFVVLTAACTEEANVVLVQEMIDVLFMDIELGGQDGCDLAHRALKARPDLLVVLASGRSWRCHATRIPAGAAFLAKPYRLSHMIDELHRAVQGRLTS